MRDGDSLEATGAVQKIIIRAEANLIESTRLLASAATVYRNALQVVEKVAVDVRRL